MEGFIGEILKSRLNDRVLFENLGDKVTEYERLIMPVELGIELESVILNSENSSKLKSFLDEYSYKDEFVKHGLNPINRLLFYGASGTGKTFLTKALSNYLKYPLLSINIAQALSEGNIATNFGLIFELSELIGECIIFLDECDAITWSRDAGVSSESGEIRRATNSLFQYLDQMNKNTIFIAATNMYHRLDVAFTRRFDMKLEFRQPEGNIDKVIEKFTKEGFTITYDADTEVKRIIHRRFLETQRVSYYELQIITEKAMKRAIMRGDMEVLTSEVYKDIAIAGRISINF